MTEIQSIPETRGIFKKNTLGNVQLRITDFSGNPIDPETILVTITNTGGEIQASDYPEKVIKGFYVYDWTIARDQESGKYIITWDYTVNDVSYQEVQQIIIAEDTVDSAFYSGPKFMLRQSLEFYIGCALHIPVYHEQARPSADLQTYQFTKSLWNQTPSIRIYRNQNIITDGAIVNYYTGTIIFKQKQMVQDVIAVDYTFRWFSDEQIDQFLDSGIQKLNAFPPMSPQYGYTTLMTHGTQFIPAVLYGAAVDALRSLLLCLNFQEPQQFFGGPDAAQKAFSNIETLKQNYEKTWQLLMEQKKLGPYPTPKLVVVPEFTLPGGRSRWFRYLFAGGS